MQDIAGEPRQNCLNGADIRIGIPFFGHDALGVLGIGSTAEGDLSQVDLPRGISSGLREASKVLEGVKGIGIVRMAPVDVIRHEVVARIVEAYGNYEAARKNREIDLKKQEK